MPAMQGSRPLGTFAQFGPQGQSQGQLIGQFARWDMLERISQPYRSQETVAAADTQTAFYTRANPTILQGNYLRPNSLPEPNRLVVNCISVQLPSRITTADAELLLDSGFLTVRLNQRDVISRVNIRHFPAGGGAFGTDTTAATANPVNGFPSPQNLHPLEIPFEILPNEHFEAFIDWAVSLAGLAAPRSVELALWGPLERKPSM